MICHKCGEDLASAFFSKMGAVCDQCYETYDMGRHREIKHGEALDAQVFKLESGKLGVICPHCGYKVHRGKHYYSKSKQSERCRKCGELMIVKPKGAK